MKYKEKFFIEYWYRPVKEKTLIKRRARFERRVRKGRYEGKNQLIYAKNSLYRTQLKKRATKEEIIFGDWLWKNKIFFNFQKGFIKLFHRIADFYIPETRTIIEIDGGYHKETVEKDKIKDLLWQKKNYKIIRIKNESILDGSFVTKF